MKIPHSFFAPRRRQNGSTVLVFITLLAIMMILITAESRSLWQLRREVRFLEQQQIKRWNAQPTNLVATTTFTPIK